MFAFAWKPEFSVNIKAVDDQHKKLIDTVNILYDAMSKGQGKTVLTGIINELADYTIYHFNTEEDLMTKYSFPFYNEHKREHDKFIAKVSDFKNKFDKKEIGLSIEIINFLSDWIYDHVLNTDKKYGPFLNEKGVL